MAHDNHIPKPDPNRSYPHLALEKVSEKQYIKDLAECGFTVRLDYNDLKVPTRATRYSAGYDFVTPVHISLEPGKSILIPTGIKAKCQEPGIFLAIYLRSSLGIKKKIMMPNTTSIIDADYYNNPQNEGNIYIPLVNMGSKTVEIPMGERIAQGIFTSYYIIDNDNAKGVRVGGIGSTGSK